VSEVFIESTSILSDVKIVKMMSDYGFLGFGWYIAITAELYRTNGKYSFGDLGIIARNTGIDKKKLRNFIDNCINKYTCNDKGIFQADDNNFWSEKIIDMLQKQEINKTNGVKGGRPKLMPIKDRIKIEGIEFVNLEKADYTKLCEKWGKEVIDTGIQLLDNWLAAQTSKAKQHLGKNHKYQFRKDTWVINEAKKKLQQETASKWGNI